MIVIPNHKHYTCINGSTGAYDRQNKMNKQARYGRNAMLDYRKYLFLERVNPEISDSFELRYSPEGKVVSKQALMGASYEELYADEKLKISDYAKDVLQGSGSLETNKAYAAAKRLDFNKDGCIDIAENAAMLLYQDYCSDENHGITGIITSEGREAAIKALVNKKSRSSDFIHLLYENWNLGATKHNFLSKKANKVDLLG